MFLRLLVGDTILSTLLSMPGNMGNKEEDEVEEEKAMAVAEPWYFLLSGPDLA